MTGQSGAREKTTGTFAIPGTADHGQIADEGAFFSKVFASSIAGVYVYDLRAQHNVYINDQYTRLTGYTLAEINAMGAAFLELFHPDDRASVLQHMGEVQSAADGEVVRLEYRFRRKSGDWTWLLSHDLPFERDAKGDVTRFLGSFVDITEQKRVQEDLEHFAHIAAHDLRAPARRIKVACTMLSKVRAPLPERSAELLSVLTREADQMLELIRDLRALTAIGYAQTLERQPVALDDVVRPILEEVGDALDAKRVRVNVDPLPTVDAYEGLLRPLYRNLLGNALTHGPEGMTLTLDAEKQGDGWMLGVTNTGSSIDPALADEVFQAFRRFGNGAGTGIGLAICRRIVEFHGGRIWLEARTDAVEVRFILGAG